MIMLCFASGELRKYLRKFKPVNSSAKRISSSAQDFILQIINDLLYFHSQSLWKHKCQTKEPPTAFRSTAIHLIQNKLNLHNSIRWKWISMAIWVYSSTFVLSNVLDVWTLKRSRGAVMSINCYLYGTCMVYGWYLTSLFAYKESFSIAMTTTSSYNVMTGSNI